MLQWGCAFSSAEILEIFFCVLLSFNLLQWGCAFSSAEILLNPSKLRGSPIKGFNGAALFQAQK